MDNLSKQELLANLSEIENEIEIRFQRYPCFYAEYVHKTDLLKQIRSKLKI